jgi:hypothetical protein
MNIKTASATILIGVFATSVSMAAKPLPPQPPPFAALTTCPVEANVRFPAIAYSQNKYKTVKKFGGWQVYDGANFYIANSTGSCSIQLHSGTREYSIPGVSYRQIGDTAHMAYVDGGIRLLKFKVSTAAGVHSVQNLPSAGSLVFAYDLPSAGINDVELSADAKTIYYSEEHLTDDERWIDTVNSIDVSNGCSSACPKTVIYDQFPDNSGVAGLSVSDDGYRIYMSIHFRVADIRTISLLQKIVGEDPNDVSWAFRNVLSDHDQAYSTVDGFGSTTLGKWDYDHSDVPKEVLAYVVERPTGERTDIVDVTNCAVAAVDESCLGFSEISVVKTGIAGAASSFTSTPSSPTDGSLPNLLLLSGGGIFDFDLDGVAAVPIRLLDGGGGESAD